MKLSESKADTPNLSVHRNSVKGASATEGSILHRIPDIDIPLMDIDHEYDVEKLIAEGCFARILLVHHRPTNAKVVLKAVHVELTTLKEFIKEYHYSYQLSHHPNILSAYQVAFQATDYYVFAQEYAPYGMYMLVFYDPIASGRTVSFHSFIHFCRFVYIFILRVN